MKRTSRSHLHRLAAVAVFVGALLVSATAGGADPGITPKTFGPAGAVSADGPGHDPMGPPAIPPGHQVDRAAGGHGAGANSNLSYHGGPVLHSNTTFAIFWLPSSYSMAPGYQSTITQFFADVAHASGGNQNVYSTDPQYTDSGGGHANYASTFGDSNATSWVDTSPIGNDCNGQYAGTGFAPTGCVVDSDLHAAVLRAIAANPSWGSAVNPIFFVFTPRNVGSCFDTSSHDCAYTSYCAYHDYFGSGGQNIVYTSQPYTDTSGISTTNFECDSGEQPNGNWADETLNVTSHEHNEAVTDPYLNAWYDSQGNEDGDKCAWGFGSPLGGSAGVNGAEGTEYNQVINGHNYYLQQEWNNAGSNCVQRTGASQPAPTISGISLTSGPVGTAVTITGTNFTNVSSVAFSGAAASFTVNSSTSISTTVPAGAKTGPITVTTPGGTATSATFTVTTAAAPDFTIAAGAQSLSVARGHSGTVMVTITPQNGFAGTVSLAVSGLPRNVTGSFSSVSSNSSTLTIDVRNNAKTGTSNLTITGTSGSLRHSATVSLRIT